MQVWVSSPRGFGEGEAADLAPLLKASWIRSCREASADLHFVQPNKHEIHAEFLTRLWLTDIAASDDDLHLISEIDFIVFRDGLLKTLDSFERARLKLLAAPYCTRIYKPDQRTDTHPGKLVTHATPDGQLALCGAWFLMVRKSGTGKLRSDWLAASSQFNDAANYAMVYALEDGFASKDQIALIDFRDAWPMIHGATYPQVGLHAFFARELDAPADKQICWHECKHPLTAGEHRDNLKFYLQHAGSKLCGS